MVWHRRFGARFVGAGVARIGDLFTRQPGFCGCGFNCGSAFGAGGRVFSGVAGNGDRHFRRYFISFSFDFTGDRRCYRHRAEPGKRNYRRQPRANSDLHPLNSQYGAVSAGTRICFGCQALGASDLRIIFRHILPGSLAPLVVQATLSTGTATLEAAGLGFLGLGAQPPVPELGTMLSDAFKGGYALSSPWTILFPGLLITLTVLGFNLLGDGLRDALDPRSNAAARK